MVDPSGHYAINSFNCYAYAFGKSNRWMIPGQRDWGGFSFLEERPKNKEVVG